MKKLLTLVVAGCMVLGSLGSASAIDVKVNGQWWFWYGYASNPMMQDTRDTGRHADRLNARQRMRTQIQFIADENLSAMLGFEANMEWGNIGNSANGGAWNSFGAINADGTDFGIKSAYLDWTIPNTQVKTRMGMQYIAMPGVAFRNPVLSADVAGVSVSTQFTPEVGLTGFWARPYNGSNTGNPQYGNQFDEMDVFGLMLPIKTDIVRATPWAMAALIGKDSYFYNANPALPAPNSQQNYYGENLSPADIARMDSETFGWWIGTTFELPVLDPFFVKLDAMYGKLDTGYSDTDTSGWYVAGDIGYKFSFASVSAIGFYSSGSDSEDDNGQLPIISTDTAFNVNSNGLYGLGGTDWRRFDGYLSQTGQGLWGLGFKVDGLSFVDKLTHTLLGMWYGGTNEGDSYGDWRPSPREDMTAAPVVNRTLATSDHAWELTLINKYQVSENLTFRFDVAYIQLELGDTWNDKDETKGNFITGVGVEYRF